MMNIEEDDPEDDFWTELAAKKEKRKIWFSNKKKAKYTFPSICHLTSF
jgi:hypothetical protein